MKNNNWWIAALSESVSAQQPHAAVCDGEGLVLFRNARGQAHALEDRCPHRRVPLSLGLIKPGGLQCAYHGWTFDGATGACTAIPNLRADEAVPASYSVRSYPVHEAGGFIHVWLGDACPAPAPAINYHAGSREWRGQATVTLLHEHYLATLLDGPQCLLEFDGVRITDFFLGDTKIENGSMVLDRGAVWTTQWQPSNFVTDYPLIVRSSVPLAGGTSQITLLTGDETPLITIVLGSAANLRGTTSVCWRGLVHDDHLASTPWYWRLARSLGRTPFKVVRQIDGAAVAALLLAPARDFAALRTEHPLHFHTNPNTGVKN